VLLELKRSDPFLAAPWVVFPCDCVQLQLLLHTMALLLKLELVQLPLRLVQLLRAWQRCETRATGLLLPQPVELPLRLIQFQGALEILKLLALAECVDVFLLGRMRPRFAERVSRRPAGGRSQKHSGQ
jgi:hypothetical protein